MELREDLSEVSKLYEFLLRTLASKVAARFNPRAEDFLVLYQLRADQRKHFSVGLLEGSVSTAQMVEPSIQKYYRFVFLVQR